MTILIRDPRVLIRSREGLLSAQSHPLVESLRLTNVDHRKRESVARSSDLSMLKMRTASLRGGCTNIQLEAHLMIEDKVTENLGMWALGSRISYSGQQVDNEAPRHTVRIGFPGQGSKNIRIMSSRDGHVMTSVHHFIKPWRFVDLPAVRHSS